MLIQKDRLYSFFSPIGEAGTATRGQAESLYQTVLDSFRFLEETTPTAPNAGGVATPAPSAHSGRSRCGDEHSAVHALVDVNIRSDDYDLHITDRLFT